MSKARQKRQVCLSNVVVSQIHEPIPLVKLEPGKGATLVNGTFSAAVALTAHRIAPAHSTAALTPEVVREFGRIELGFYPIREAPCNTSRVRTCWWGRHPCLPLNRNRNRNRNRNLNLNLNLN